MQSSLIGKIEKARRYAQEPDRVTVTGLQATFRGENDTHTVRFDNGEWTCGCEFFGTHRICCHTMALERLLQGMTRTAGREAELMGAGAR
ncbi:MAG: hypothetical protein EPO26_08540 [Chloroflexota bacterium]|nr:MAG: hypothetical protein EPO26_08540 [Chloroflexota bacterium]